MSQTPHPGVALVTGASSGIGATYADRLAKRGFDLLLVARDKQRLEAIATKLRSEAGVQAEILRADLSRRADVVKVEQRLRSNERISMLVNNAGIGPTGPLLESDPDYLDDMILINVAAVNRLAIAAAATFVKRGSGTIVNIASVIALMPEGPNATYSGTKAFVLNLTQGLEKELVNKGVRVQAVLPGLTRTEIFERAGIDTSRFNANQFMDVGELVDAALAGLDQGELVTIPSLPDPADWSALQTARRALGPNLSKDHPAARYTQAKL